MKGRVTGSVYRKYNAGQYTYDYFTFNILLTYNKWIGTASKKGASFQYIFEHAVWVGDNVSDSDSGRRSGSGSSWEATYHIRATLDSVINYIKQVTSKTRITKLDAPFADIFWMSMP